MNFIKHIAIIMDGNGRWANLKNMPRLYGHKKGAERAKELVLDAAKKKLEYLTLFAFSSENWDRPLEEVSGIMNLLAEAISSNFEFLQEHNIRLKILGDLSKLPSNLFNQINHTINATSNNTGLTVNIALSYGARDEILQAALKMTENSSTNIEDYLYTSGIPDPDLLIRTGGEKRISNFLLWQIAYAELYFVDTLWPDFEIEDFERSINEFTKRKRRFGKL